MQQKLDSIIAAVVDSVETEFYVDIKTDDGGPHFCIHLPWESSVKKLRQEIFKLELTKRCLIIFVPEGYIETFLRK